ncbi:MAG: translocation/assembly module TamB domain-containing protein [Burkholderiaceae bacterium]
MSEASLDPQPANTSATLASTLRIVLLTLVLLVCGAIALVIFLMSPLGLPVVMSQAKSLVANNGATLTTTGDAGSLYSGLSFESLIWTDDVTTIKASRLRADWSLINLLQRELTINELFVDRLDVRLPPSPNKPGPREAITLPDSLALPISIDVQRAQLRHLSLLPAPPIGAETGAGEVEPEVEPIVFKELGLSFRYRNSTYTVSDITLTSPWAAVSQGRLALQDSRPYPVDGRLRVAGEVAPVEFDTDIRLFGDLDLLRLSLSGSAIDSPLTAQATLKPLAVSPVNAVDARLESLATNRLNAQAPGALLDLSVRLRSSADDDVPSGRWRLLADLKNIDPGVLNEQRLPLKAARASIDLADPTVAPVREIQINDVVVSLLASQGEATVLGDARIDLSKRVNLVGQSLPEASAQLSVSELDLAVFSNPELQTRLSGQVSLSGNRFEVGLKQLNTKVTASGAAGTVIMDALPGRAASVQVQGVLTDQQVRLDQASIVVGETSLSAVGSLQAVSPYRWQADASIASFKPDQWLPNNAPIAQRWRAGILNGELQANGTLKPGLDVELSLMLEESRLAGQPLQADVRAGIRFAEQGQLALIKDLKARLAFGKNRFSASGSLAESSLLTTGETSASERSTIDFELNLAQMSALDARIAGRTKLTGAVSGTLAKPVLALTGGARRVRIRPPDGPASSIGSVTVKARVPLRLGHEPDARLSLDLRARDLRRAAERIVTLSTKIEGSVNAHSVDATLNLSGQNTSLKAKGAADLSENPAWRGTIESVRSDGRIRIRSKSKAGLSASSSAVNLTDLALVISGSGINPSIGRIERLSVDLPETVRARVVGQLQELPVAQLVSAFRSNPLPSTLNNLRLTSTFDLSGSGADDLTGVLTAKLAEQGAREDKLGLAGTNEARFEFTDGTVDGDIDLTLPSLGFTRRFTGPSWVVNGQATLAGTVTGQLTDPRYLIRLTASDLSLLQPALGWRLDRGKLLADISDRGLNLRALRLRTGDDGKIEMTGRARILKASTLPDLPDGSRPTLPLDGRFNLNTEQFVVPIGPGQQLILSGETRLFAERGRLRWVGNLMADEGLIEIAGSGAPALPDDVQIVSAEPAKPAPTRQAVGNDEQNQIAVETALDISLGDKLRIMGGGVNARLTGKLTLLGQLPANPRAQGLVEIKDGTYQAYSQDLRIRRGDVRFNGPIDNPALNIEAVRPNLPVTPGVSITGLALSPRIDLFSDPAMTDAETLSWLVLGVPIDNAQSGAQSLALKEAASRIIGQDDGSVSGGSFSDKLGLDTLGFGFASDTGQAQGVRDSGAPTGLPGAGGQTSASTYQEVVTLGKKLSDRLSISYEQGVRGLFNLLRIQYEINQRLSLRAQTGSENAVDLLYFWSFD